MSKLSFLLVATLLLTAICLPALVSEELAIAGDLDPCAPPNRITSSPDETAWKTLDRRHLSGKQQSISIRGVGKLDRTGSDVPAGSCAWIQSASSPRGSNSPSHSLHGSPLTLAKNGALAIKVLGLMAAPIRFATRPPTRLTDSRIW